MNCYETKIDLGLLCWNLDDFVRAWVVVRVISPSNITPRSDLSGTDLSAAGLWEATPPTPPSLAPSLKTAALRSACFSDADLPEDFDPSREDCVWFQIVRLSLEPSFHNGSAQELLFLHRVREMSLLASAASGWHRSTSDYIH